MMQLHNIVGLNSRPWRWNQISGVGVQVSNHLLPPPLQVLIHVTIISYYTYYDTILAQKPKLIGLDLSRYINYSLSLYFINIGHKLYKCIHKTTPII